MNGSNYNIKKYIFMLIIGVILVCPINAYAKEELVTCYYESDGASTKFQFIIYDNYSTGSGRITWFQDNPVNESENLVPFTFNKSNAKNLSKDEICPNYAIIYFNRNYGPAPDTWKAFAYYSKESMEEKVKKLEKKWGFNHTIISLHSTNSSSYATVNGIDSTAEDNASNPLDNIVDNNKNNFNTCEETLGKSVVEFLQQIFNYIKILGPILVILFSSIDFTQSIMANDDQNMKKSQKKLGIRLICAVGLYFLPMLATLIINLVFGTSGDQVCGIK